MNINLIHKGVDVSAIRAALDAHPELWNEHTARTQHPSSPHHGLDDIWVRFGNPEHCIDGQPHEARWYPSADVLGVKPLIYDLFGFVQGDALGGVLITRIPAGATCKPHRDNGWHAHYYKDKFAVQIAAVQGQRFCFEGESLEAEAGDVYWFNNQSLHWVENPTEHERITMIVCIRKGD